MISLFCYCKWITQLGSRPQQRSSLKIKGTIGYRVLNVGLETSK